MDMIADLWLPILLSAVAVFFASFVAWMVLPHHKADIRPLPDEKGFTEQLAQMNIPAGFYMWPNCHDPAEMKSEEFKKRYADGPWGSLAVQPAQPNFGLNLVVSFLFYIAVSTLVGYLTYAAHPAGASFGEVFQVAATGAILAYCAGQIPGGLFMGRARRFFVTDFIDCLVYALLTAFAFAILWPSAPA